MSSELQDAATVVVVRPATDRWQLYMLRRHGGHDFMSDVWVFPGGGVDPGDATLTALPEDFDGADARRRLGDDIDETTAVGLYVAAIRETFEEAGLLLARRSDEAQFVSLKSPPIRQRFREHRREVDTGRRPLEEIAADHELVLAVDRLACFAHWITPHFEDHRYDTRFFAVPAPAEQTPSHDDRESTRGRWWSPREAIDAYRGGDIQLAPPTLRVLEELAEFSSVSALMDELRDRPPPPTILPHLATRDDAPLLLLPGDPDYPDDDPRLAAADPVADGVTRMVRRDGLWYSIGE